MPMQLKLEPGGSVFNVARGSAPTSFDSRLQRHQIEMQRNKRYTCGGAYLPPIKMRIAATGVNSPFPKGIALIVFKAAYVFFSAHAAAATPEEDAKRVAQMHLRESAAPVREQPNWQKPKSIVVVVDSDSRLSWLRQAMSGSATTLVPARTPAELRARIGGADAMLGPCIPDVIAAGTRLRWIQVSVAGAEDCLNIEPIRSGKVILSTMQRVSAVTVSEHAMAMVLVLSRGLVSLMRAQTDHRWLANRPSNMTSLDGKTMLIIGLGGVGTEVAARAHAFGMRIIATRYSGHEGPEFVDYVGTPEELPTLIERADVVVNCTPLTKLTTKMIDARLLGHMRRSAYLINVGRGASVVTEDLVSALKSGQIAGAALDVVDPEPLPKDSPLWQMPNVLITPHLADNSEDQIDRLWVVMRENLRRYVHGDKLLSVVDVNRGY